MNEVFENHKHMNKKWNVAYVNFGVLQIMERVWNASDIVRMLINCRHYWIFISLYYLYILIYANE